MPDLTSKATEVGTSPTDKAIGRSSLNTELLAFKRDRITEEASHLFYEYGYSSCTLDMLAERLKVTKPFLYSYFKNKEAILAAICETGIREAMLVLEEALDHQPDDPREILATVVRRVGRIVIAKQEHIVVYQREMKHLNDADFDRILRLRHSFDHRIADLIRDGISAGKFREDVDPFVSVWIGGLISWIPTWYSPRGQKSADEVVEYLVKAALRLAGATE